MKSLKHATLIPILALALLSCANDVENPAVVLSEVLDNQSSYDLAVTTEIDGVTGIDTIESMTLDTLFMFGTFGQVQDFSDCILAPVNPISIEVIGNDTLEVSLDPNDNENWNYTIITENSNGGGEGMCTLEIADEDIE